MEFLSQPGLTPGAVLSAQAGPHLEPHHHLWGFGGLHGGLALATLVTAMHRMAPSHHLVSVTGQFLRPVREAVTVEASVQRAGGRLTSVRGALQAASGPFVTATASFAAPGRGSERGRSDHPGTVPAGAVEAPGGRWAGHLAPRPPAALADGPLAHPVFRVPTEFVPIAQHNEVRPIGPNLPFAGGTQPELAAWIRLLEDDAPPDLARLVFLLDALAPSYAAVLTEQVPIPTVELSVRPGDGLPLASSPWVLVAARTISMTADGWIDEQLTAWGPDGAHLGSAQQVRVVLPG